jgi:hypothetical protein
VVNGEKKPGFPEKTWFLADLVDSGKTAVLRADDR